jgi:hypothetical protein
MRLPLITRRNYLPSLHKLFLSLLLAIALMHQQVAYAQSTVVDSVLASTGSSSSPTHTTFMGFRFQVGSVDRRISEWSAVFNGPGGDATLYLYAVDAGTGLPLSMSAPLAMDNIVWTPGVNTYSATDLGGIAAMTLFAGRPYALVLQQGSDPIGWYTGATNYTFAEGFTQVGTGTTLVGLHSGGSWVTDTGYPVTQLKVDPLAPVVATPAAIPTLQAEGLWLMGLLLALFGAWRMRTERQ